MTAIELIEQQQKGIEGTAPWMVGEQLKDICRRESASSELVAQDLALPEMSLKEAEKKIKAFADGHKTGNFSCVTPAQAEKILRDFYGLHSHDAAEDRLSERKAEPANTGKIIDLMDFLG